MTSDASLSGFAVCETGFSACDVENVGKWDERWRFRLKQECVPRGGLDSYADPLYDFSNVCPVVDGRVPTVVEVDPTFPQVPK